VLARDRAEVALRGAVLRGAVLRGVALRGAALRGAALPGAEVDAVALVPSLPRALNCLTSKAVPPTVSTTGHSTNPVAPIAPSVSNAAGVEWLPALSPLRIPAALPCTPPMMPLIAAPPTAPAAAVVAFAVSVMRRVVLRMMSIALPALYYCL
jgi:hypothetical protein